MEPVVIVKHYSVLLNQIQRRSELIAKYGSYGLKVLPIETVLDKSLLMHRCQAKTRCLKLSLRPPSIMRPQLLDKRATRGLFVLLLQVRLEMKVIIWTNTERRTCNHHRLEIRVLE